MVPPTADTALRVAPRRKRMPRAAGHHLLDQRPHARVVNVRPRDRPRWPRPHPRSRFPGRRFGGILRSRNRRKHKRKCDEKKEQGGEAEPTVCVPKHIYPRAANARKL